MNKNLLTAVLLALFVAGIGLPGSQACDQKCRRKVERAIEIYTRSIEKAEQKQCSTAGNQKAARVKKRCAGALKSLDKLYDKFEDDNDADVIVNHPRIMSLRQRHLTLKNRLLVLGGKEQLEELADPAKKKIKGMKKNTKKKIKNLFK